MKTTLWMRDGNGETCREYADRYPAIDDEGGLAICETGDEGTFAGLIVEEIDPGTWLRIEVEA